MTKTKAKTIADIGISRDAAKRYQQMAAHPEIVEQAIAEAQEIAELVTLSEMRMGEMLSEIPKASGGDRRSDGFKNQPSLNFEKPKTETLADMGITRNAASEYQQMAAHPEIVEQAIAEAQEIAELVTLSEMRMGEMLSEIPKATNGGANQYQAKFASVRNEQKPKADVLADIQSGLYIEFHPIRHRRVIPAR